MSRMGIFAKKGLPRSHLLWRPLWTFTTIGTEVFLFRHVQSSHRSCLCVRKTVRTIRTRKDWPYELYICLFKNQRRHFGQTVNILSCSFLPDAVMEPTPPGTVQFETMSTWLQFSSWDGASNSWTCKLDSVSSMNIFPKKGLPKGHFASAATRDFHDNCEQKFFLEARAIKSQFLPVRTQDIPNNLNKERLATWTI